MPGRGGAANRRDRGRGGGDRRGGAAASCCEARTTSRALDAAELASIARTRWRPRSASAIQRRPSEDLLRPRRAGACAPRRGARLAAITSGGTIPESGNYDVVIESQGRKIGDVEEDFAQESIARRRFLAGLDAVANPAHLARPADGRAGAGDGADAAVLADRSGGPIAGAVRRGVRAAARDRAPPARERTWRGAAQWLEAECALDDAAAAQAVAYVAARASLRWARSPTSSTIVVERFFDGLGGTQIVIHSPLGIRFNRALRPRDPQAPVPVLRFRNSGLGDRRWRAARAAIRATAFRSKTIFTMLNSRTARDVLVQAMLDAPMFEMRFRHVATRALGVMRSMRAGAKCRPGFSACARRN